MIKKMLISFIVGIVLIGIISILLLTAPIYIKPNSTGQYSEVTHFISYFVNLNQIEIKMDPKLNRNELDIEWNEEKIYISGKMLIASLNRQRYKYGPNSFKVYYEKKLIGQFYQFKMNNWHYHKYEFIIERKNEGINAEIFIIGPDTTQAFR